MVEIKQKNYGCLFTDPGYTGSTGIWKLLRIQN